MYMYIYIEYCYYLITTDIKCLILIKWGKIKIQKINICNYTVQIKGKILLFIYKELCVAEQFFSNILFFCKRFLNQKM